jgi:hypothetical protein
MYNTKAYSAASATSPLASTTISRRDPTDHDVQIEILFCGICHSDLHSVRNEWREFMPTVYPIVPGHEIVGRVTKVDSAVTKYKPGDLAAVGCLVDSDRTFPRCKAGLENFCPNRRRTQERNPNATPCDLPHALFRGRQDRWRRSQGGNRTSVSTKLLASGWTAKLGFVAEPQCSSTSRTADPSFPPRRLQQGLGRSKSHAERTGASDCITSATVRSGETQAMAPSTRRA